ncbi:MAG TPA: nucleoside-diphosphate sugar epimerase/dehydratase, partial [Longimicrobiales bacterium]|nr:nucleoside-diphosphate sugar epimerase/dehydratase [Longimicrobiales bacterium]
MEALRQAWSPAYALASNNRRAATMLVYCMIAVAAYGGAFLLRFDFAVPPEMRGTLALTLPVVVLLRLAASYFFRISTGRWRYVSTGDVVQLVIAASAATLVLFGATWGFGILPVVPRSILLIDLFLYTWLTSAVWILYRTGFEQFRSFHGERGIPTRVLIVGAGEAGSLLAREMGRLRNGRRAVGFVDDDPAKRQATVHGLPVIGTVDDLQRLVERHAIHEIVIAVPSASPSQLRRIVERCEATDLAFKVLPPISEVLTGKVAWSQVRPLRIEDLLGRDPVALELPELFGDLNGRSVLITGAAGSIGSELARQVALHHPLTLILFDQSETGLFDISRELHEGYPQLSIHFIVGDITDELGVNAAFRRYAPSRVFHAAAYKHVTMMQSQVRQAIRNNVEGTLLVANAAGRFECEKFVFVSTDKAVTPTSIMGATKRLAEMLLMELQPRFPETSFASVRFGNVLGSNGSVIPIFRQQIEQGKPLTVTHPEATRYFMMIPEAVQLILQASLLPEVRGQIVMLDMGEPVRIIDLARNLLRLAGLPHQNGKAIVFTGLREGEKLHEELTSPGEETLPTAIEKVHIVIPEPTPHISVLHLLPRWKEAFEKGR